MRFIKLAAGPDPASYAAAGSSMPADQQVVPFTANVSLSTLKDACTNIIHSMPMDEGESWHLIDASWFQKLKKYAESKLEDRCAEPTKLDNSGLLDDIDSSDLIGDYKPVRNTLRDGADYVLVPDSEWKNLQTLGLVDATQDIHRYSVGIGREIVVEVHPLEFIVCQYNGSAKSRVDKRLLLSRRATCDELDDLLRPLADGRQYRIWRRPHGERMELFSMPGTKMQAQLKDIDFCDKEMLILETKHSPYEWSLDAQLERHLLFPNTEPVFAPPAIASESSDAKSMFAKFLGGYNLRSLAKRENEEDEIVSKEGKPDCISRQPESAGRCGLINLGNTCFMDSMLQCLIHLPDLRDYFLNNLHSYEVNINNPLGHRGRIGKAFGDVVQNLWKKGAVTYSPRKFKHVLGQEYPQFYGFWEQDSQEFMTYLLDGVHEDVNRIQTKPYVEYGDADGRDDRDLARESWYNFRLRNQSVIVDLFFGMIKSTVTCPDCNRVSVTFDPVNQLSCPLPEPRERSITVFYVKASTARPHRMQLTSDRDGTVDDFLQAVSNNVNVPKSQLVMAELLPSNYLSAVLRNDQKLSDVYDAANKKYFVYQLRPLAAGTAQPNSTIELTSAGMNTDSDEGYYAVVCIQTEPKNDAYSVSSSTQRQYDAGCFSSNNDAPAFATRDSMVIGGYDLRGKSRSLIRVERSLTRNRPPAPSSLSASPPKDAPASMDRELSGTSCPPLISNDGADEPMMMPFIIRIPTHNIRSSELYQMIHPWMPSSPSGEYAFDLCQLASGRNITDVVQQIPRSLHGQTPEGAETHDASSGRKFRSDQVSSEREVDTDPIITFVTNSLSSKLYENSAGRQDVIFLRVTVNDGVNTELPNPVMDETHSNADDVTESSQARTVELHDCIRTFIQPERLSEREMWFCATCREDKRAEKKLELWDLPAYLIIHLKRFSFSRWRREKLRQHVRIPAQLDMSQYVMNPAHVMPVMYDFAAVSNHTGDLAEGHYWAHIVDRDGRWIKMNDDIVRESSYAEAAGNEGDESAYLVFFKLRGFQYDLEQLPVKIFSPKDEIDTDATSTVNWPTNIGQLKRHSGERTAGNTGKSQMNDDNQHFGKSSKVYAMDAVADAMEVDDAA